VIHQPVSVASQCGAGAWLNGLASGDQRRRTGSGSASEACSRRCAIYKSTITLYFCGALSITVRRRRYVMLRYSAGAAR